MRTRTKIVVGLALTLVMGACATAKTTPAGDGEATGPKLSLRSPRSGSTQDGNVVVLDVVASGIEIVKPDGDASGKTGHFHVFIDREPPKAGETMPKEAGIVHSPVTPIKITGLSVGKHTFKTVLGTGAHTRIGASMVETVVDVTGPSLDASAPASIAAGASVPVTIKVEGVQIVKADGDSSGKTGHFHLFVDRDPITGMQAIPKEAGIIHATDSTVTVPGLAAGEHTIWVVMGDGNHVPFPAAVMDKVVVTVT